LIHYLHIKNEIEQRLNDALLGIWIECY
jgi:hypothetical protein